MFDVWKITIRPKTDISLEEHGPSAISLLAWCERGNERYALVLKNNGRLREIFSKAFGLNTADQILDALMANRVVNIPGSFTTRQLNSLGFRL